jgi:1,4-dihydroxy-2-naphthoate octaprenyltransferase
MAQRGPQPQGDQGMPVTPSAVATSAPLAASASRPLADHTSAPRTPRPVALRARTPLGRVRAWASAGKAHTLVFAVLPVLVAAALLWATSAPINVPPLLALAVGAALVLAGANLLDAYLDYIRAQALSRAHPGASIALRFARYHNRLVNLGIYPLDALRVAIVLLVAGGCLGIPAALAAGLPGLLLGLAGLLVAFLYSATSLGLKRLPLGEVAVLLALGPGLFILTLLTQQAALTSFGLAVGAALGLYALAALEAANLRAISPEERDGRRTAIRLLGEHGGRVLYLLCLAAAYLTVLIAAALPGAPHGAFAIVFSLPVVVVPATGIWRARNSDTLTPAVRGMLRAYIFFAFWLIVGLLVGALYLRLTGLLGL